MSAITQKKVSRKSETLLPVGVGKCRVADGDQYWQTSAIVDEQPDVEIRFW